ncbi:hypothetical protein ED733_003670 [Metarhizium rileyi]|uniref:Copper acquisition factor BIM1-like domain-containing protein n=1 Tax=Metarhizium rileyi (strain RCEF 4871) TaxID=1649241 RepID=A0A5C6G6J7_METRR|nr:hypothetical protein ED733_003670 [Metarhizium rileyi]
MLTLLTVMTLASSVVNAASPASSDEMGPAAFMWPADRVWSAAADNTAPCGSIALVGNRTNFPMTNGQVAIVDQKEAYSVELGISYKEDPRANNDFTTLIKPDAMAELDKGHMCVNLADPPSSVKPGANATLQIKYIASFDKPETRRSTLALTSHNGGKSTHTPSPTTDASKDSGSGSSGLSGGAIAGIVIGVLAGAALLGGAALFVYRRKQQRLQLLRQKYSARGVKWDGQPRDSNSNRSAEA